MKIVVSGGGTGGHIMPILAVLEELQKLDPQLEILFVGSGNDLEKKILHQSGYRYVSVSSGKFRRYGRGWFREAVDIRTTSQNIHDAARLSRGVLQARRILRDFEPDVVFTKGGFVGVPVGLAASKLGAPLLIHESDSLFGMANRFLAKRATVVATGFPVDVYTRDSDIDTRKLVYTGNPIRHSIIEVQTSEAEKFFPFDQDKPVVLFTGASQGAHAINIAIFDELEGLCKKYNIIHLTGEQDIERARFLHHRLAAALQSSYMPFSFLQAEMGWAYHRADVVVARASMSTLMEIAATKRPGLIIPLPSSSDQPANARLLARMGAVRTLEQKNLTPIRLKSEIDGIVDDKTATAYRVGVFHKLYRPDAATHVAQLLYQLGKGSQKEDHA